MEQHNLSLYIPNILNECIIKIEDISVYAELLAIDCPLLQITPPGFTYAVHFHDGAPNGSYFLTAVDLELGTSAEDPLPDGVYVIRYSVSPNDKVFVEYNYLRTTSIMNKYYKILCNLEVSNCEPPRELAETLNKMRMIKMLIEAAKAKVEYCHSVTEGMDMYAYALKLLNRINCKTC